MIERFVVACVIIAVAVIIACILGRQKLSAPTQGQRQVPSMVDRNDFAHAQSSVLIALFSAQDCQSCDFTWEEMTKLEGVAIERIEYPDKRDLHLRYGISQVPLVVVADAEGKVHAFQFGKVNYSGLQALVESVPPVHI